MLSKKTKYGLKALIYLAKKYESKKPVLISKLAVDEKIPKKFLELILLELKNAGLLQSKMGKGGGYLLAKPPLQITFGQSVRVLEGPLALTPCVSQMSYEKCVECLTEDLCEIRLVMKNTRDAMAKILDGVSLQQSILQTHEARQEISRTLPFDI